MRNASFAKTVVLAAAVNCFFLLSSSLGSASPENGGSRLLHKKISAADASMGDLGRAGEYLSGEDFSMAVAKEEDEGKGGSPSLLITEGRLSTSMPHRERLPHRSSLNRPRGTASKAFFMSAFTAMAIVMFAQLANFFVKCLTGGKALRRAEAAGQSPRLLSSSDRRGPTISALCQDLDLSPLVGFDDDIPLVEVPRGPGGEEGFQDRHGGVSGNATGHDVTDPLHVESGADDSHQRKSETATALKLVIPTLLVIFITLLVTRPARGNKSNGEAGHTTSPSLSNETSSSFLLETSFPSLDSDTSASSTSAASPSLPSAPAAASLTSRYTASSSVPSTTHPSSTYSVSSSFTTADGVPPSPETSGQPSAASATSSSVAPAFPPSSSHVPSTTPPSTGAPTTAGDGAPPSHPHDRRLSKRPRRLSVAKQRK